MTSFDMRMPRTYTRNQGDVESAITAKAELENRALDRLLASGVAPASEFLAYLAMA